MKSPSCSEKTNPIQTQFESERRTEKWNLSHTSPDYYYRITPNSPDQIHDDLLVRRYGPADFEKAAYKTLADTYKSGPAKTDFKKGNRSSV